MYRSHFAYRLATVRGCLGSIDGGAVDTAYLPRHDDTSQRSKAPARKPEISRPKTRLFPTAAQRQFDRFSAFYQADANEPRPLFLREAAQEAAAEAA